MPLVNFANHITNTTYEEAKQKSSDKVDTEGRVQDIFEFALDEADERELKALEAKGQWQLGERGLKCF
jgi:hypothetical protein